jgi:hypothetical protein
MVSSKSSAIRGAPAYAHENEKRNRQQHFVRHDAEDPLRQRTENAEAHGANRIAEHGEDQRGAGEREGDRITGHQRRDHGDHHQNCQDFRVGHQRALASTVAARIACTTPCKAINTAKTG